MGCVPQWHLFLHPIALVIGNSSVNGMCSPMAFVPPSYSFGHWKLLSVNGICSPMALFLHPIALVIGNSSMPTGCVPQWLCSSISWLCFAGSMEQSSAISSVPLNLDWDEHMPHIQGSSSHPRKAQRCSTAFFLPFCSPQVLLALSQGCSQREKWPLFY